MRNFCQQIYSYMEWILLVVRADPSREMVVYAGDRLFVFLLC